MNSETTKQSVAIGAMVFGVAAVLVVGGLTPDGAVPAATAPSYLAQIEQGQDHIDAETLARELMAARGDTAVADLRPAAEFAAWHLPGAVRRFLDQVRPSIAAVSAFTSAVDRRAMSAPDANSTIEPRSLAPRPRTASRAAATARCQRSA